MENPACPKCGNKDDVIRQCCPKVYPFVYPATHTVCTESQPHKHYICHPPIYIPPYGTISGGGYYTRRGCGHTWSEPDKNQSEVEQSPS